MSRLLGFLMLGLAASTMLVAGEAPGWDWQLPGWVPVPNMPADNPMTSAKVEGERLPFRRTFGSLPSYLRIFCSAAFQARELTFFS